MSNPLVIEDGGAVAIDNGLIKAVGGRANDVLSQYRGGEEVINRDKHILMPGSLTPTPTHNKYYLGHSLMMRDSHYHQYGPSS